MKGKQRCKILKDIRRRIAEENDITYITTECKHKGECRGTCPKCEAEVKYLESELERRRSLGYKVTVAGLAAGIALGSIGCTPDKTSDNSSENSFRNNIESSGVLVDGELVPEGEDTMGEPLSEYEESAPIESTEESDESIEIMGDLPAEWYE